MTMTAPDRCVAQQHFRLELRSADLSFFHAMAAEELAKIDIIRDLSDQVSQLVIEEVSVIQENLEIERTCRESAEALASKLNRQNRSLKRKSMMLLSHLSPNAIAEINLEDDEEEEEEEDGKDLNVASKVCLSPQCHTTISELQSKLELTLKEKRQAETDLEAIRDQLRETREELLKEKNDNTVLIAETLKQKKLLGKYNRVSQFAVEEYKALQDTLSLEQNLRTEAENFGRAMMIEKKKLQRQSQILMQSSSPSHALQEALTQVTSLTRDLETQRLGHQNQIKQLEDRLSSCEAQRELTALRRKLDLVEEEKREYSDKCSKTEVEVKDLRFTAPPSTSRDEELQRILLRRRDAVDSQHDASKPRLIHFKLCDGCHSSTGSIIVLRNEFYFIAACFKRTRQRQT
ncbi:hypothetical protein F2P81_020380 [Scophthalmus maximus]|uniref:Shootin-1 n=1 Tax=Scophthalmus maximus TaxID=52904 RepID=A0A6A4S524_SCOMX|nr:hypothetical protein F2P81_020380 [Scophthalmus maximus]